MLDQTKFLFTHPDAREAEIYSKLYEVYLALQEKGYNPINQIVGYVLSGDPTYITNHKNARSLICKIDREEFLNILVSQYLDG